MKTGLEKYITECEYVENKSHVLGILASHKLAMTSRGLGRDGEGYNVYKYYFRVDGVSFAYSEGVGNEPMSAENKAEKCISALWCLLNERQSLEYCTNVDEFCREFGYDEPSRGRAVYNTIIKNTDKLSSVFTSDELDVLTESIQL